MILLLPATLLLAATAPASTRVPPPVRLTAQQQARLRTLTQKLGECHRSHAQEEARTTKYPVKAIVAGTLAACKTFVVPIRAEMVKLGGELAADVSLARQQQRWEESIKRNVAAARAAR